MHEGGLMQQAGAHAREHPENAGIGPAAAAPTRARLPRAAAAAGQQASHVDGGTAVELSLEHSVVALIGVHVPYRRGCGLGSRWRCRYALGSVGCNVRDETDSRQAGSESIHAASPNR